MVIFIWSHSGITSPRKTRRPPQVVWGGSSFHSHRLPDWKEPHFQLQSTNSNTNGCDFNQ